MNLEADERSEMEIEKGDYHHFQALENSKEIEDAYIEIEDRYKDEGSGEQFMARNILNYESIE